MRAMASKFCEREKHSKIDMIIPIGFFFQPTDEQLLIHYLKKKSEGLPLPCDMVFERDVYGVGDKAPWQLFTEEDPWTEHSVYVLTRLIKASKKGSRVARTAGCGSWVADTGTKIIKHKGAIIGCKKMLTFKVNKGSGAGKDHWIMHEYSLSDDGKSSTGEEGEYVLCKITNKSAKDLDKLGDDSAADENIVPKLSKRARLTEFVPEKKTDRDIMFGQTEVVCPSEDQFLQEKPDHIMFGETEVVCPSEEQFLQELDDMMFGLEEGQSAAISNGNFHTAAKYLPEPEPLVLEAEEPQEGFSFDFDEFGYISSTTEVLHSGFDSIPVPDNLLPPSESFHYDCDQYLNLDQHFECMDDLSVSSDELLHGDQESDGFLFSNSGLDATTEPSPASLVSNNMHVELDPETIWRLKNISWPESNFPQYGYGGEIVVVPKNKESI